MISDNETLGGAAVAASRLAEGLVLEGAEVVRIVGVPGGSEHSWSTEALTDLPARRRDRLVMRALGCVSSRSREQFRRGLLERTVHEHLARMLDKLKPDVINVHNIHRMQWPPSLLQVCCSRAPTVWTLHDMWSFTGRCAYSYDCRKFVNGCDASCPTPNEYPALAPDKINGAWNLRSRLFADCPGLVAVCPSVWLKNQAIAGLWCGHRVEHIPYGLPLNVYRPINRDLARQALGIEAKGPVVLVVAQSLEERRKGASMLREVFRRLRVRPLTLVTLGQGRVDIPSEDILVFPLGYVDHERGKALAYSAADMLIHPAPVDNLPNVVMEALACGTPCAAFPIGGLPDMVRNGVSGWLASEVTAQALANAVGLGLDSIMNGTDVREGCRKLAENEYGSRLQAQRYLELFKSASV
jgi:glycosyltransferase involved in cell wall biosynthesis